MERKKIIEEIKEVIENHGSLHCYKDIIGNCLPSKLVSLPSKTPDGIFYDGGNKKGYIQGFHINYVTVVKYRNNIEPVDSFSIEYEKLSLDYLTQCLNFLRRK